MTATQPVSDETLAHWQRAQSSLARHALGISRHLQSGMMDTLQVECGHSQLRLSFAPYVTLIGEHNFRPTELAEQLGITRQACNQAIRQLEAADYVGHVADPEDGRAKLLTLSKAGQRLRRDGVRIVSRFDTQYASFTTETNAIAAAKTLRILAQEITLSPTPANLDEQGFSGLAGLLPRFSDYITHRLMELTRAKGHSGLKLSFVQVIPLIGAQGGRIQQIAAAQDVSKQAISVIAMELAELGYLSREPDPTDARQIVLYFTEFGIQLMSDAADCVAALEAEFTALVGAEALALLTAVYQQIFEGLGLENGNLEQRETVDLKLLAQQLTKQLGLKRSKALGQLLTNFN